VIAVSSAGSGDLADDYPYRGGPFGAIDPWGFTTGECTSFVAWRLNRFGAFRNGTGGRAWRDADHWDDNAAALGFAVTTRPAVGAVAHWNAYEGFARGAGHVGYVARVNDDGTALVEDYNGLGDHAYRVRVLRAPRYIRVSR
jgi:surface antigen